jgi:hypothetical protein
VKAPSKRCIYAPFPTSLTPSATVFPLGGSNYYSSSTIRKKKKIYLYIDDNRERKETFSSSLFFFSFEIPLNRCFSSHDDGFHVNPPEESFAELWRRCHT